MNYEKIAIISLLLLVCPLIRATEYTVDKVPNVHLDDGRRFVSNPDGILSAETVNTLDQMLFSLQEANTSEVAVVALQSIGDDDIDDFATELFTRWGIGKQTTTDCWFCDTRPTQNYIPHRVWYRRNITRCYL